MAIGRSVLEILQDIGMFKLHATWHLFIFITFFIEIFVYVTIHFLIFRIRTVSSISLDLGLFFFSIFSLVTEILTWNALAMLCAVSFDRKAIAIFFQTVWFFARTTHHLRFYLISMLIFGILRSCYISCLNRNGTLFEVLWIRDWVRLSLGNSMFWVWSG